MTVKAHCVVCGSPVPHAPATGEEGAVCLRADCRFVLKSKLTMPASIYPSFLARQSAFIKQRLRETETKNHRIKQACDTETSENQASWQSWRETVGLSVAERFPLVAVPHNARKVKTLPERRKREFRDLLNKKISRAMETRHDIRDQAPQPADPPRSSRLLSRMCTLCRGACCLSGGDHAFIQDSTLLRVMNEKPDLRPRHLLALYLSYVGGKTVDDGCVYQGETGCTLPAQLRSNVCSDYYCDPLRWFDRRFTEEPRPEGAFVVVRAREHWPFPEGAENGIDAVFLLTGSGSRKIE